MSEPRTLPDQPIDLWPAEVVTPVPYWPAASDAHQQVTR